MCQYVKSTALESVSSTGWALSEVHRGWWQKMPLYQPDTELVHVWLVHLFPSINDDFGDCCSVLMFPDVVALWWFRISHHQHESNAQRPIVAQPAGSEADGFQGDAVWQELIWLLTIRKSWECLQVSGNAVWLWTQLTGQPCVGETEQNCPLRGRDLGQKGIQQAVS